MPHDLITIKQDIVLKSSFGGHDQVLLHKYAAPSDGDGNVAYDPYMEDDLSTMAEMMKWLHKQPYAGYPWVTMCEKAHHMAGVQIKILMGEEFWYAINLIKDDLFTKLAEGAGQILERYNLPRDRFDLGAFLIARERHSRLILPSRRIPG